MGRGVGRSGEGKTCPLQDCAPLGAPAQIRIPKKNILGLYKNVPQVHPKILVSLSVPY